MTPRRILFAVLCLLVIGSLWRTVSVERDTRQITQAYQQARQMVEQLETERTHLNQELSSAHETLEGQTSALGNLQQELKSLQVRLDQTAGELAALQREHEQLQGEHTSLLTEKQQLEAKLSSLKELRLAIHDVRRKMWNERLTAWHAHIQQVKEADQRQLAEGNRGYIVRDGAPTLGASQRLRVHVLEPQSQ